MIRSGNVLTQNGQRRPSWGGLLSAAALLVLLPVLELCRAAGAAAAPPSAHYLPAGPRELRIRVVVERPTPSALIVMQHLPPGAELIAADPPPAGFDPRHALVRWFFRQPRPGTMVLTIKLSQPMPLEGLPGDIRFRHPAGGETVIVPIGATPGQPRRP
ncbi:MAG: hypothetical protein BWK76_27030 [Desulfobulbaceae bacterium A2]|nr:MAG: hypothetical protein BWK76_27030 [Desulfobulbaceae bacterium A2]